MEAVKRTRSRSSGATYSPGGSTSWSSTWSSGGTRTPRSRSSIDWRKRRGVPSPVTRRSPDRPVRPCAARLSPDQAAGLPQRREHGRGATAHGCGADACGPVPGSSWSECGATRPSKARGGVAGGAHQGGVGGRSRLVQYDPHRRTARRRAPRCCWGRPRRAPSGSRCRCHRCVRRAEPEERNPPATRTGRLGRVLRHRRMSCRRRRTAPRRRVRARPRRPRRR